MALVVLGGGVAAAQSLTDLDEGAIADAVRWAVRSGIARDEAEVRAGEPVEGGQVVLFLQRLDAMVAQRQLATGPISFVHSPILATVHAEDTATLRIEPGRGEARVAGEGRVLVPLSGPADLGGRSFVFSSVEVCLSEVDGAVVDAITVWQSPDGGAVRSDTTGWDADGCITYTGAGSGWVSTQAATLELEVGTPGTFRIDAITAVWVPS